MIAYIKGIITQINIDSLIIENHNIGYEVFFARPESVSLNQEIQLFTYHKLAEDESSLYGFSKAADLRFFKQLLSVKGIGAKSAMIILAKVNIDRLMSAIAASDIDFLKSISGVGNKSASQIILDLQGKLTVSNENIDVTVLSSLQDSLRSLGYRPAEIAGITEHLVDVEGQSEAEILKQALQLLAKRRG
jgi:Holliday junction DNA helicase RuvA